MDLSKNCSAAMSLDESDGCSYRKDEQIETLDNFEDGLRFAHNKGRIVLNSKDKNGCFKGPYFDATVTGITFDEILELEHVTALKLAHSVPVVSYKKSVQMNVHYSHTSCEHLYSKICEDATCVALWRPNRRTINHEKPGKKKTSEKFREHNKLHKIRQRVVGQERDGNDMSATANFSENYDVYSDDESDDEYYYDQCDIYSSGSDSDNEMPVCWMHKRHPMWRY